MLFNCFNQQKEAVTVDYPTLDDLKEDLKQHNLGENMILMWDIKSQKAIPSSAVVTIQPIKSMN